MADTDSKIQEQELTPEEIAEQEAAELPEREAMSLSTRTSRPRSTWPPR